MLATVTGAPGLRPVAVVVVVGVAYLFAVRAVDLNEKEPLWALAVLFAAGAAGALAVALVVPPATLHLTVVPAALAQELARLVALAAGLGVLGAAARWRGWSEVNGLVDGVVYGFAAGLGFAVGTVVVREIVLAPSAGAVGAGALRGGLWASVWPTALYGLFHGVLGSLAGAGFGAAAGARWRPVQALCLVAGLAGALAAHVGYLALSRGGAVGQPGALGRTWLALGLPLLVVALLLVVGLSRERRGIEEALAGEDTTLGAVELRGLRRRLGHLRLLVSGRVDLWHAERVRHNRQVQLALLKRRAGRAADPERRSRLEDELGRLRQALGRAGAGDPQRAGTPIRPGPRW